MKNKDRKAVFKRWWKNNRKNIKAHDWLIHHTKKTAKRYLLHTQVFEEINFIANRYYKSEFRKLKEDDAWKLWRISNPSQDEKFERLKQAVALAETKMDELAEMRKDRWQQPEKKKKETTVVVKKKRKWSLNSN